MSGNSNGNGSGKNVVDLSTVRKRPRAGAQKHAGNGKFKDDGYDRALRAQRGVKGAPSSGVRWFHYGQVILLLLLVAWMMHSCNL